MSHQLEISKSPNISPTNLLLLYCSSPRLEWVELRGGPSPTGLSMGTSWRAAAAPTSSSTSASAWSASGSSSPSSASGTKASRPWSSSWLGPAWLAVECSLLCCGSYSALSLPAVLAASPAAAGPRRRTSRSACWPSRSSTWRTPWAGRWTGSGWGRWSTRWRETGGDPPTPNTALLRPRTGQSAGHTVNIILTIHLIRLWKSLDWSIEGRGVSEVQRSFLARFRAFQGFLRPYNPWKSHLSPRIGGLIQTFVKQ